MILNLENLRQDYKGCRKNDNVIAFRLSVLIEFTKMELGFNQTGNKEAKAVKIRAFCISLGLSLRTIER